MCENNESISHPIWKYFDKIPIEIVNDKKNVKHQCKNCQNAPSMAINQGYSNLIKHLDIKCHKKLFVEYHADFETYKQEIQASKSKHCTTPRSSKRARIESKTVASPLLNLGVTHHIVQKFSRNNATQKIFYDATVKMLIKTMYPVSFVEHPDVVEWLNIICPPFNVPCRNTIKNSALPKIRDQIKHATIEQFKT